MLYPILLIIFFFYAGLRVSGSPFPFRTDPLEEFSVTRDFDNSGGEEVWYARQQLFFRFTLCPTSAMNDFRRHKEVSLVFFSTFEPISFMPDRCMQRKGVPMLNERAATILPTLYVCPVDNVLGRVPLIPCYLHGNTRNTISYKYRLGGAVPVTVEAAADSRLDS
jgi:hypothetical protein